VWDYANQRPSIPSTYSMRKFATIEEAIRRLSLTARVRDVVHPLNDAAMHELEGLGLLFHDSDPEPTPTAEDMEAVRVQTLALIDAILADEAMPAELRAFLLEHLYDMMRAIDLYPITGALPMRDVIDRSVVQFNSKPEVREQASGERFRDFTNLAFFVLQLTSAVADAPAALNVAREVFGAIG